MNDDKLIVRAQRGDSNALIALYEEYKQQLFRYFFYRFGDLHLAEDLTTDVFIRVMQALANYQHQGSFAAWIFEIARNLGTDYLRKTRKRTYVELPEEMVDPTPTPEHSFVQQLTVNELWEALDQLTEEQREVITLRFIAALPIAEVAESMGKSESAIKNLQSRALRTLNRRLSHTVLKFK